MACVFLGPDAFSDALVRTRDVQARVAVPADEGLHAGPPLDVLEKLHLRLVCREVNNAALGFVLVDDGTKQEIRSSGGGRHLSTACGRRLRRPYVAASC